MKNLPRFSAVVLMFVATAALAADSDEILGQLQHFLDNVGDREVHERFWADDLVYTSSAGTRTDKASILAAFGDAPADDATEPGPTYAAEDVKLSQFGNTAVVAFKLVATPPGDLPRMYYFNTGTFVKRDGEWRVVAWQATKIPPADD